MGHQKRVGATDRTRRLTSRAFEISAPPSLRRVVHLAIVACAVPALFHPSKLSLCAISNSLQNDRVDWAQVP
jgi:hypothetical protein